jgi:antitoxin component YwqK of YwqJK toxin-antitoxin module
MEREYSMHDVFKKNKLYHREDGPAYIVYRKDGGIQSEEYYIDGKKHRDSEPSFTYYDMDGMIIHKAYYKNGKLIINA